MTNFSQSQQKNKARILSNVSLRIHSLHIVLLAKEETVLQGMVDKLIETGRYYGMEMNVEKNKSNENFKTTIPSNNYDRPKTTGECEMF